MPDLKHADAGGRSIKVGVIADQTGPLSVMGLANANVARMVIGDLNAKGGLLGRHVELCLEDSETNDAVAAARAAKLVEHDRVDVVFGGIYSSTSQAIKQPVVVKGRRSTSIPSSTRDRSPIRSSSARVPVPAQQVDPFIPWLMRKTGAKKFYLPSADYIWPRVMNQRVREVVTAQGGSIVGEEYFPLDHSRLSRDRRAHRLDRGRRRLQHDRASRSRAVLRAAPRLRFHSPRRPARLHVLRRERLAMLPTAHADGLYSCLDYYQTVDDPFSRKLLAQYDALYPGQA
jgi:branched-chain amino acid transport system substrate-binding protein